MVVVAALMKSSTDVIRTATSGYLPIGRKVSVLAVLTKNKMISCYSPERRIIKNSIINICQYWTPYYSQAVTTNPQIFRQL